MLQDLRFALRLFRRHPAPVAIAVGGLALAIGVVTAVFSLVNASMLRPYGMDDPASVVIVARADHGGWGEWRLERFRQFQEGSTLGRVEASTVRRLRFAATANEDDAPGRTVLFVSGGYLPLLGGRPALGRTLGPGDDTPGVPAVIVVSDHVWRAELDGDPAAVGRTVWLNGAAVTVVGVMRPEFTGPVKTPPSIWATFAAVDDVLGGPAFDARTGNEVEVIARLAPAATSWAMEEQLSAIDGRNRAESPASRVLRVHSAASPIDGPGDAEAVFVIGTTVVALGLLMALACANTANLLMASAMTRAREMGVRVALGASSRRLVRQTMSESLVLAGCAAGLGLLVAVWLAPALRAVIQMPPEIEVTPDARVLLFATAVAVLCGLGSGLAPARHGARGRSLPLLQSHGGTSSGAVPSRWRSWFVGFQAAGSVLLLVVAAMLARTALARTSGEVGFDVDRLVAIRLAARQGIDRREHLHAAVDAVRALPGVERGSVALNPWLGGFTEHRRATFEGRTHRVFVNRVDAEYLATAGLRVLRGRPFSERDLTGGEPVALLSAAAARAIFADANPIGRRLAHTSFDRDDETPTIVGIVNDTVVDRLHSTESVGALYRPMAEPWPALPGLVVRAGNPARAARAIVAELQRLEPRLQASSWLVREGLESVMAGSRMLAQLAGAVASLAFVLAGLGVYGVTSFVVSRRAGEVSIRMAIGASASDVLRLLVGDALRPVLGGLAAGLVAAIALAPLFARPLSIVPFDAVAVAAASATLLAGALVAVIPPARRAARTDPSGLLRG
jgi:putative ABC transport system permease protein